MTGPTHSELLGKLSHLKMSIVNLESERDNLTRSLLEGSEQMLDAEALLRNLTEMVRHLEQEAARRPDLSEWVLRSLPTLDRLHELILSSGGQPTMIPLNLANDLSVIISQLVVLVGI